MWLPHRGLALADPSTDLRDCLAARHSGSGVVCKGNSSAGQPQSLAEYPRCHRYVQRREPSAGSWVRVQLDLTTGTRVPRAVRKAVWPACKELDRDTAPPGDDEQVHRAAPPAPCVSELPIPGVQLTQDCLGDF